MLPLTLSTATFSWIGFKIMLALVEMHWHSSNNIIWPLSNCSSKWRCIISITSSVWSTARLSTGTIGTSFHCWTNNRKLDDFLLLNSEKQFLKLAKWQFYLDIFQSATLPFPPNTGVTYNVFNHLGQMRSFPPTEPGFSQVFFLLCLGSLPRSCQLLSCLVGVWNTLNFQ